MQQVSSSVQCHNTPPYYVTKGLVIEYHPYGNILVMRKTSGNTKTIELVANCDRFNPLKHSSVTPYALILKLQRFLSENMGKTELVFKMQLAENANAASCIRLSSQLHGQMNPSL